MDPADRVREIFRHTGTEQDRANPARSLPSHAASVGSDVVRSWWFKDGMDKCIVPLH